MKSKIFKKCLQKSKKWVNENIFPWGLLHLSTTQECFRGGIKKKSQEVTTFVNFMFCAFSEQFLTYPVSSFFSCRTHFSTFLTFFFEKYVESHVESARILRIDIPIHVTTVLALKQDARKLGGGPLKLGDSAQENGLRTVGIGFLWTTIHIGTAYIGQNLCDGGGRGGFGGD